MSDAGATGGSLVGAVLCARMLTVVGTKAEGENTRAVGSLRPTSRSPNCPPLSSRSAHGKMAGKNHDGWNSVAHSRG